MRNILIAFLLICVIIFSFTSCSTGKVLVDPKSNKNVLVENYGLFNPDKKVEGVLYGISPSVVLVSIIFSETIIVPFWLVGWELYHPIKIVESK